MSTPGCVLRHCVHIKLPKGGFQSVSGVKFRPSRSSSPGSAGFREGLVFSFTSGLTVWGPWWTQTTVYVLIKSPLARFSNQAFGKLDDAQRELWRTKVFASRVIILESIPHFFGTAFRRFPSSDLVLETKREFRTRAWSYLDRVHC